MQVPAGAVLCGQGERHRTAYFVREGVAALATVGEDGEEQAVALRGPSSLLCLESRTDSPSPFEIQAVSALKLCAMPVSALIEWVGPERSPARAVTELLLQELDRRQEDLSLRSGESLGRVARFLMAARENPSGEQPLQKQLVARILGIRAETLSRCLAKLVERGLIASGGPVRVLDPRGLAEVATGGA